MKSLGMLSLLGLVVGSVVVGSYIYKLQDAREMVTIAEAARDAAAKTGTSLKERLKSMQDSKVFIEAALKQARRQLGQLQANKLTADARLAKVKDQLTSAQTARQEAERLLTSAQTARQEAERLLTSAQRARRRAERLLRRCNAD